MTAHIHGIGTATPRGWIDQTDAAKLASHYCCPTPEQERLLPTLYRRTRVHRRHSIVLSENFNGTTGPDFYRHAVDAQDRGPTTQQRMQVYQANASELGVQASREAIAQSGFAVDSITHLITVSCTGFYSPGFDVQISQALNLSPEVSRTHIGFMGCHAAMNAIRAAQGYVDADAGCRVLVCAVELCSLHHQYGWDPEQIVANALFADGAAAIVLSQEKQSNELDGLHHISSGSLILPDTQESMTWLIGDHGYVMTLSSTIPDTINQHLRSWLSRYLRQHDFTIDDIGGWLVHPGGPRIIDATVSALGLDVADLTDSMSVLSTHGNMSSPTVLFVMQAAIAANRPGPYLMLGFGPGLAIEAALFGRK